MFRSTTIILKMILAKVILILKHFVKLRRYLLCGGVAACLGKACVFNSVQYNTQHTLVNELCVQLYMFRTYLLSIIRSLNTVFTATGICRTTYVDCLLADSQHKYQLL